MADYSIKIPEFEYIDMGGHYSGSKRGMDLDDFNFHIVPKDDITVDIWYGVKCFDLSEMTSSKMFEKTRDGYHEMLDYIEEQYQVWLSGHKLRSSALGMYSPENNV